MKIRACLAAFSIVAASGGLFAQQAVTPPLGDVAKEAEAAKATAKKAKKTYTNADLTADPHGEPAPATVAPASGFVSKSLGRVVAPEELVARSEEQVQKEVLAKEPEEVWRGRAESIRTQVAAIQKRIDELGMADPLRDANPISKLQNDKNLTNARLGLDGLRKQWDRLEASAKEKNINSAWLDPRPKF